MAAFAALALLVLVALYHLTIAGTLALETLYGALNARLIVAGIYAVLAIVVLAYLLASRVKTTTATPRRNRQPQDIRVAELLESLLVGYTTGRRKSRHS
jgi:membrane protein implicated in regulation of membrane protease activity